MIDPKLKKEEVYIIDYNDLDDLINEAYNKPPRTYEFVADEECGNYCMKPYIVDGELDNWDKEKINEFILLGKKMPSAHAILNDLCNKGLVPKGKILVEVYW